MQKKLLNNILLKILSVVAAMILWLVVVNIDDAVQTKTFRNIKVTLLNTDIITSQDQTYRIEDGTDTVDVIVSARRSVLSKIRTSDFVATADMQKDLRYDSLIKIDVTYTGSYALNSISQSRTNVSVSIEESVTEQFKVSVQTTGSPSDGMVPGTAVPERTLVEITGPISVVERIKRVEASVDITGITGRTTRTCILKLMNSDGDIIDGKYLEYYGKDKPFSVTVTPLNTKRVGISFDISKASPEGYGVGAIYYTPETVVIAGEKSRITPVRNLNIPPEALNAEQATGHVEQTVDISAYLPDGIQIPDKDDREIVVTMSIIPYETVIQFFDVSQIQFQNVPEGMEVEDLEDGPLEIPVFAFAEQMADFDVGMMQVTVDLSECERLGRYTMPVEITLPEGYNCNEQIELSFLLKKAENE